MEIDEIKKRLSMKDALAYYNLVPNRNNHINCPFHDDKTPSMKFFEESNTFAVKSKNKCSKTDSYSEFVSHCDPGDPVFRHDSCGDRPYNVVIEY